jgi:signal peptidase I
MLRHHVQGGELVVPPASYFAMGDNRDLLSESRYWGFVPRENIIGKPLLVYWSYDAPSEQLMTPLSLKHATDVALHFFARTRWERSFTWVKPYRERGRTDHRKAARLEEDPALRRGFAHP